MSWRDILDKLKPRENNRNSAGRRDLSLKDLEARVLYSATPIPVPAEVDAVDVQTIETVDVATDVQGSAARAEPVSSAELLELVADSILVADQTDAGATEEVRELVFVDSSVPDADAMLADLQSQRGSSRGLQVVTLDSTRNGLAQITAALSEHSGLDAVHIVSHGTDGRVRMGSEWLSNDNVAQYTSVISGWQSAMSSDADLLFYGCDLAASEDGRELLNSIASASGSDVAASDDKTGHESLNGDWVFEYEVGRIETEVAFGSHLQASWLAVLDVTTGLQGHWTFDVGSGAQDVSGKGHHGTLSGDATTIDSAPATNQIGNAKLSLGGSDDYSDLSVHASVIGGLAEGTIAGWINTTDATNTQSIFAVADLDDPFSFATLGTYQGRLMFDVAENGYVFSTTSTALVADGTWHHVAFTVDGSGNRLYVDGVELTVGNRSFDFGNAGSTTFLDDVLNVDAVHIGGAGESGTITYDFDGMIDDLRLYDRALSSADIADLSNYRDFVVSNTNDSGAGSLRQAIVDANANPGSDAISFNLPASGAGYSDPTPGAPASGDEYWTIQPTTVLPAITEAVVVDGTTQSGFGGTPVIELDGSLATGADENGFTIETSGTTIRGFAINRFADDAIEIDNHGGGNTIVGNYLGTDITGSLTGYGNRYGITIKSGDNTIGGLTPADRNVISGNNTNTDSYGIGFWQSTANNNDVLGNYIGVGVDGSTAIGNLDGIYFDRGSNNTIGTVGAGNIVSANSGFGINVPNSSDVTIQGNIIGTGIAGTEDLGNSLSGISVTTPVAASNIVIGGYNTGEGNLIAFNHQRGIVTSGTGTGDRILGNIIHDQDLSAVLSDRSGTLLARNVFYGNSTTAAFDELVLGDNQTVYNNTIHGASGDGVSVEGNNAIIRNNIITGSTGVGIRLDGGSIADESNNLITGAATGPANLGGQANFIVDSTTLNADPQYADALSGDFALTTPGSPAINAGFDLGANQPDMNGAAAGSFTGPAPELGAIESASTNTVPTITSDGGALTAALGITENSTAVTTVAAFDPDVPGQTLVYSIIGGVDATSFSINASNGELTFDSAPDFESPTDTNTDNAYEVIVQVSDGQSTDTQAITVSVTNIAITAVSGSGTGNIGAGATYTLNLSADEDATGWTINWGDGSFQQVVGDPSSVTHTYAAGSAGRTFDILLSATDAAGDHFDSELIAPTAFQTGGGLYRFSGPTGAFDQAFSDTSVSNPYAAVIGPDGLLYVAGHTSDNVTRFNATTGAFVDEFVSPGAGGLNAAAGLTFGPDGNLYVSNQIGDSVLQYDGSTGAFLGTFVSAASGGLNGPVDLTFRADGYLYVSSYNTDSVLRYDAMTGAFAGTFVTTGSGGLNGPAAMEWGPDGNLYITGTNSVIKRFDATTGAFIDDFVTAGSGGLGESLGLAFGPDGNLYVSNYTGDQIIRYDGTTGALIGDYVTAGSGGLDGPATFTFVPAHQVSVGAGVPVVTPTGSTLAYVENDGSVALDPGVTVTGGNSSNLTGATISFTANYNMATDALSFVAQNGITGSWSAGTGVLALTGTSSVANYQQAVRSISYTTTSEYPSELVRTIQFVVDDGTNTSTPVTRNVSVESVNDDPTNIGSLPGSVTVTEDTQQSIDLSGVVFSDPDVDNQLLTVTLSSAAFGQISAASDFDVLVSGSGGPFLTLQGGLNDLNNFFSSPTRFQYRGPSNAAGLGADTISVTVTDSGSNGSGGGGTIALGDVTVNIDAVNDRPTMTTTGTQLAYVENDGAVVVDSGLTVTDVDNSNLTGATVSISTNYANGQDSLSFANQNGITGSWSSATGILTLTGTTSVANYETALRSITYSNLSEDPNELDRTIQFIVSDGALNSSPVTRDITVEAVNDDPSAIGIPATVTITEDTTGFVDLSGVTVDDADIRSNDLTVTLATATGGQLYASATPGVSVTGSGTSTLTLVGGLSDIDDFLSDASRFQYDHATPHMAGTAADTLNLAITDSGSNGTGGGGVVALGSISVDLTPVNDAPVRTAGSVDPLNVSEDSGFTSLGLGGATPVTYGPGGGADETSQTLTYTVTTIPSSTAGDVFLADETTQVVLGTYDLDQIRGMKFRPAADYAGTTAFQFNVTDNGGGTNSTSQFMLISVSGTNDPPVVDLNGSNDSGTSFANTFVEKGMAVRVTDSDAIITDVDNTTFDTLTITFGGESDGTKEKLVVGGHEFQATNSDSKDRLVGSTLFRVNFDGAVFTITEDGAGVMPRDDLELLLLGLTYENEEANPTGGVRTFDFILDDAGGVSSVAATSSITLVALNDPPTLDLDADDSSAANNDYRTSFIPLGPGVSIVDSDAILGDIDNSNLQSLTVVLTNVQNGADEAITASVSGTSLSMSTSGTATTYTVTITGDAAIAEYQTVLATFEYANVSLSASGTDRIVTFVANDGTDDSLTATTIVDMPGDNNDPVLTTPGPGATFDENDPAVAIDPLATVVDDSIDFDSGTLTISLVSGSDPVDQLVVIHEGMGAGEVGVVGSDVYVNNVLIGSFSGGTSAAVPLEITFNANADRQTVETVMRSVGFFNMTENPSASVRSVSFVLTDGDGGISNTVNQTISVASLNDAPTHGTGFIPNVNEDTSNPPGDLVGNIAGPSFNDPDTGAALSGIAITSNTALPAEGIWQYSTGGTWHSVGLVDASTALVLDVNALIRFLPAADFYGPAPVLSSHALDNTYSGSFTVGTTRALLDTSTNGGTTPISSTNAAIRTTILAVNDAPVLTTSGTLTLTPINEDISDAANIGNTIAEIVGNAITDADSPTAAEGIAVFSTLSGNGTWQYSVDGGTNWIPVGTVDASSALLLRDIDRLRLVPNGETGTTASVDFHAWDQTSGTFGTKVPASPVGGTTAFSSATHTAQIVVSDINDDPTWSGLTGNVTYTENDSGLIIQPNITASDVDSTDFDGGELRIAIVSGGSTSDWLRILQSTNLKFGGSTGRDIVVNGITIGSYLGGHNSDLVISLNSNANATNVTELARRIAYANTSDSPSVVTRTISFVLTDGDSGTSASAQKGVTPALVEDNPIARDDDAGLFFDGIDDYVNAGDGGVALTLDAESSVTMEAWIRPESFDTNGSLIINKEGEYEVGLSPSGELRWALANAVPGWSWHHTGYVVPTNEWTHIAVSYGSDQVSTYVNGNLVDQRFATGPIGDAHSSFDDLRFGSRTNSPADQYFHGRMDEVRVWATARTQLDIQSNIDADVTNHTDLMGYWRFNEGTGATTADNSTNTNTATLELGTQWTGYAVLSNSSFSFPAAQGPIANDVDGDGDLLNIVSVDTSGTLGSAVITTVGSISYAPDGAFDYLSAGQEAWDYVTYTLEDENGNQDTATVAIRIIGVNDAPILVNNQLTLNEGQVVAITAANFSASDPEADLVTYTITGLTGGQFQHLGFDVTSFTQAELDANEIAFVDDGDDAAPTFSVSVNDGTNFGGPYPTTINFSPVNDAPTASTTGGFYPFTEGDPTVSLFSGTSISPGETSQLISSLTFTVAGVTEAANEVLTIDGVETNLVTKSTTIGTYQVDITLTGSVATVTISRATGITSPEANALVDTLRYGHLGQNPTEADRVIDLVRVTDNGGTPNGGSDTTLLSGATATVTVAAVNDAPQINFSDNQSTTEDTPLVISATNGNQISVTDLDANGSRVSVSLTVTNGTLTLGSTAGATGLTGNGTATISFNASVTDLNTAIDGLTYAPASNYSGPATLFVTVDDLGNTGGPAEVSSVSINLIVNAANDAPVFTSPASFVVAENQVAVGTVTTTDIDGGSPVYSITGGADAALFDISTSGDITFRTSPDFEAPGDVDGNNIYDIQVTADDGNPGGRASQNITITVTDINEAPTLGLANVVPSLAESIDTASSTKVADIVINDDALGTNTVALTGPDATDFEIVGTELHLRAGVVVDFETKPAFTVSVQVDDASIGGDPDDSVIHTLTITDVNEAPSVALDNGIPSLPENTPTTTSIKVADIVITDDALGTNTLTLTGPDATDFEIIGTELHLRAGVIVDFETKPAFTVTVQVDDADIGADPDDSVLHTLTITDINEAPSVALNNVVLSLPEDASTTTSVRVADIVITDDALGTNTLTLTGADATDFEIIGTELYLRSSTALDFESKTSFVVTVEVDDPGIGGIPDAAASHTLGITDVLEAITISPIPRTPVFEDTTSAPITFTLDGPNMNALTVTATSSDTTLIPNTGLMLSGSGATRSLTLTPAANLNGGPVTITLHVTDGVLSASSTFSVDVVPVNDIPTSVSPTLAVNTSEDSPTKSYDLATLFDDVDVLTNADRLSFAVLSNTTPSLLSTTVDGTDLHVTLAPNENGVASLTIEATDTAGATAQMVMMLDVSAVNDAPQVRPESYSISESTGLAITSGGLLINDEDSDSAVLTTQLVSTTSNGTLELRPDGSFTYVPNPAFAGIDSFQYAVSDGLLVSDPVVVSLIVPLGIGTPAAPVIVQPEAPESPQTQTTVLESSDTTPEAISESDTDSNPPETNDSTVEQVGLSAPRTSGKRADKSASTEKVQPPLVPEITAEEVLAAIAAEAEETLAPADNTGSLDDESSTGTRRTAPGYETIESLARKRPLSQKPLLVDFGATAEIAEREAEAQRRMETIAVGTTAVVSSSLSVGYVIWLLRGGTLLASMVSALPAWVAFDPLPILESYENEEEVDDQGFEDLLR